MVFGSISIGKRALALLLVGVSLPLSLFVGPVAANFRKVKEVGVVSLSKLDNPLGALVLQGSDSSTAIFRAAGKGDHLAIRRMLLAGADANQRDPNGIPLLFYAVVNGKNSPQVVQILLRAGADANITDKRGTTALLHAMGPGGTVANINALLAGGADVNLGNEAGETPLLIAVDWDWLAMVKRLLAKGADPNKATIKAKNVSSIGETPLMNAAELGRVEILRLLLKSGANPRARNAEGKTPLMIAVEQLETNRHLNRRAKSKLRRTVRYLREAEAAGPEGQETRSRRRQ